MMTTQTLEVSTADTAADLDFASRAVIYLEKQGLDLEDVVDCLMDEFDLDHETAVALAALAA
jgi:hypothetical protein